MSTRPPFLDEWLKGKTREDFDLIEHCNGRLLWPVKIHKLRKNGKYEEEAAFLQVLDMIDGMDATQEAMRIFEERGFDKEDARVGDIWTELEMFARVSVALRSTIKDSDGIYPNMFSLDTLLDSKETGITPAAVALLHKQLDIVSKLQDPRLEDIDRATAVQAAMAIAETGNLSPLVYIAGSAQDTCVVVMSSILSECLRHEFSVHSLENSNKVRSPSKKQTTSSKVKPTSANAMSQSEASTSNDPPTN